MAQIQKQKVGGKSKKGRQHVKNENKYKVQQIRTTKNKERAWKKYLDNNPNDLQNKAAIEAARKRR